LRVGVGVELVEQVWMKIMDDIAARCGEGRRRRRPPPELHRKRRVGLAQFIAEVRVAATNVEGAVVDALMRTALIPLTPTSIGTFCLS
jgi:hypothetical protein